MNQVLNDIENGKLFPTPDSYSKQKPKHFSLKTTYEDSDESSIIEQPFYESSSIWVSEKILQRIEICKFNSESTG